MIIKTKTIVAELCECGRLYKDRRDSNGKMICSACHTGLNLDQLKMLWSPPKQKVKDSK